MRSKSSGSMQPDNSQVTTIYLVQSKDKLASYKC